LRIDDADADSTVNIRRIHFKGGLAQAEGAAVYSNGFQTNIESCIFSDNTTIYGGDYASAVYNNGGIMYVTGCTFYENKIRESGVGGVICNYGGTLNLIGNLFYGNTQMSDAKNRGVFNTGSGGNAGTVNSNGYNMIDLPSDLCGWVYTNDFNNDDFPFESDFEPMSFYLHPKIAELGHITILPADYPRRDFYGKAINRLSASVGAVQFQYEEN